VTDEAGLAAEARSFDAWGRPRNADWTPAAIDPLLAETPRDFTDHEHIQTVGLIHMNGRVQDPVTGRFISPDPSDALNLGVGFNRYAYALNNPLSYTDPSGHFGVVGFAIGVGLELTRQAITGEITDTSWEGIAKNAGKAVVAGAAGALGGGIATGVARVTTSIAARAAMNGVAGAAIGATSKVATNAIEGNELTEGVGTSAAIGGLWAPPDLW